MALEALSLHGTCVVTSGGNVNRDDNDNGDTPTFTCAAARATAGCSYKAHIWNRWGLPSFRSCG